MGSTTRLLPWCTAALAAAITAVALAASETPPPGATWTKELSAAQADAIRAGRPIFAYFTKTH